MPQAGLGFRLSVIAGVLTVLTPLAVVGIAKTRESSRRSKCGRTVNQLAVAQQNIATSG